MTPRESKADQVVLGVRRRPREGVTGVERRIDELIGLTQAAGGDVVAVFQQERTAPDGALYLGKGKVSEIADCVRSLQANLVIFDGELSPAQLRNISGETDCRVIDRTQLILDIFAARANSRVGRLQVEMAQLEYLLPRLSGRGVQMSRLGGGIGTRGPGETQLEVDRRRIRDRIWHLREQLNGERRQRGEQRKRRVSSVPAVALVGYTNAGKSTLLQRWTEDRGVKVTAGGNARQFDTLDPLARRVQAGIGAELVVLDTVGLIEDLPHQLIDAFRATLEEVASADVIVHVLDASGDPAERAQTTYQVLREIGAADKPIVSFYNKVDQVEQWPLPDKEATVSVYGSAKTGEGTAQLYRAVEQRLGLDPVQVVVEGPQGSEAFWSDVSRRGKVISAEPGDAGLMRVTLEVNRRATAPGASEKRASVHSEVRP